MSDQIKRRNLVGNYTNHQWLVLFISQNTAVFLMSIGTYNIEK